MNIKQKIGGAIATGAFLATIMAPGAMAATTVRIVGNGALSTNDAVVLNVNKSKVKQSNYTKVKTFVGSWSNTGSNDASFNTGGTNTISTGGSTTRATVNVDGGTNINTSGCGCPTGDTTVVIRDNGALSDNDATVINVNKNVVKQSNTTVVSTAVLSHTNTGDNSASFNTGGNTSITTGDSTTTANVTVTGSSNVN